MKTKFLFSSLLLACSLMLSYHKANAQDHSIDTIITYGQVVNGDTIPLFYLQDFLKYSDGKGNSERAQYWRRLRYNVYKVYPYALKASSIVNDIDMDLNKMPDKRSRRAYLRKKEKELNAQFKNELKDLSTTQGAILVKLINRQTGKDVYSLIRELKGTITAGISQGTAYFFDNNLKAIYDPYGTDQDIELIVREIETKGFFR